MAVDKFRSSGRHERVDIYFTTKSGMILCMTLASPENNQQLESSRKADRRQDWIVFGIIVAIGLIMMVVNATSILTEAQRDGETFNTAIPWITELTSALGTFTLVPAILWLVRRNPINIENWWRVLPLYFLASAAFSAAHVTIMVWLRKLIFTAYFGHTYIFFGDFLRESLYEFRKDFMTFATFVVVLHMVQALRDQARELAAAKAEAQRSGRFVLKCGGRTMWIDANAFNYAQAAGNYVEVIAGGTTHLARMSLTALDTRLKEAGIEAIRTHRSYLVNRNSIVEISPTKDGDVKITLSDGVQLPGSRRYRDRLPNAA